MKSTVSFAIKQSWKFNSTSQLDKVQTVSTVEDQEGGESEKAGGKSDVVAQLLGVGAGGVGAVTTLSTEPVYHPQTE